MIDYQEVFSREMPAPGDFEQCYAFSIHKAGSSLMHSMIGQVCAAAKIPAITIPDIMFREGVADSAFAAAPQLAEMLTPGRVYYGFRSLPPFVVSGDAGLAKRPIVLLVRDPRDALVSQYYSFGGKHLSHRSPEKNKEQFLAQAKETSNLEIDEYVLKFAPAYLQKLQRYRDHLDLKSILLRRYEEIYFDKRKFIGEIFEEFRLPVASAILDEVAKQNDIRPEGERIGQHIRKGQPGDYLEKLAASTVDELNTIFYEIGHPFGYDLK